MEVETPPGSQGQMGDKNQILLHKGHTSCKDTDCDIYDAGTEVVICIHI